MRRIQVDGRQYREAVNEFGDMVYRIALNQTRLTADADDITQAVFLKLYEKPPAFLAEVNSSEFAAASNFNRGAKANRERLKAWLIRVTVNECKSLWRTLWRRRVDLRDIRDEDMTPPPFAEPNHERLYEALGRLPEKCRIVVHLFYFEDYSTAEIAIILEIKEPTVRSRLTRARKLLREQLKEEWENDEPEPEPGPLQSHDGRRPCSY